MTQRRGPKRATKEKAVKTPSRPVRDVLIRHEPVELASLLKFGDVVSSGGEAKILIQQGMVQVNGEVETRPMMSCRSGPIGCARSSI